MTRGHRIAWSRTDWVVQGRAGGRGEQRRAGVFASVYLLNDMIARARVCDTSRKPVGCMCARNGCQEAEMRG